MSLTAPAGNSIEHLATLKPFTKYNLDEEATCSKINNPFFP
jgi:hypothetical protein